MSTLVVVESVEGRRLFAVTPVAGLDPTFAFDETEIQRIAGKHTVVYSATPAPGDKTYFLAQRYDERKLSAGQYSQGYLTIARVTADGKLDKTFGTGGVALTERTTEYRQFPDGQPAGILKVDSSDRLYVADSSRVLRLRANGTIDKTFGSNGAAFYASPSRSKYAALTDIAPTADGVYVSSYRLSEGIERFTVQEVGQRVRTVWTTTNDTGVPFARETGEEIDNNSQPTGQRYFVPWVAKFAPFSRGGVMLAHVESDYRDNPDTPDGYEPTYQQVVVTRFDADGAARFGGLELRKGIFGSASLHQVALRDKGLTLLVKTNEEVVKFDFAKSTGKRYDLPGDASDRTGHTLLSDGSLFAYTPEGVDYRILTIEKLNFAGKPDESFADDGVLTLRLNKKTDAKNYLSLGQLFLSSSGRLYLTINGSYGPPSSLQRL